MLLTRRDFLRSVGAATLLLSLDRLGFATAAAAEVGSGAPMLPPIEPYRTWEDVFREKWTWDRVVRCTHNRSNCMSACAWDVYVKDGLVWREEQAHTYDEGGRDGTPDFFPRGCQKGACYSQLMASPQRLRYPLERVGERGSGKWKRISWDEALDKVADGIIDAATRHGSETIIGVPGPNFDHGPDSAAEIRLIRKLGATSLDTFAGIGDMPVGMTQTYGMFMNDGTIDDYFRSDYIVLWSANPLYTRIPDMHFITEARYRGATVVVISPDYNATSMHADVWLNPRIETDTALALAMAQVMLAENLHKPDYVKEQTDLPFLVRTDNGKFLLERDVVAGGREDVFYLWDEAQSAAVLAPGSQGMSRATLALGEIRPALQGRWKVKLADGTSVDVEPLYQQLRRGLDERSTPELVEKTTGVAAGLIREVARKMAAAKSALIYASTGACKHYHSDLMHRSFALLMALTGNQGRPGGGVRMGSWWGVSGYDELGFGGPSALQKALMQLTGRPAVRDMEAFMLKRSGEEGVSMELPWLHVHAGYDGVMGNPAYNDPANPLSMDAALKTSLERKWVPVYPAPGKDPKVFIVNSINPLRRWAAPQLALKHLWPKFDLVVNINFQMSTTGMHSDILLPAAAFYEKIGIKYAWCFLPYLVLNDKAVEPQGESRNEWWIYGSIAERVQKRARAKGVATAKDAHGNERDLSQLFDAYTEAGVLDPADPRTGMNYIFERTEICEGTTWDEAIKRGVIPIKRHQPYGMLNNICSDVDFTKPLYPNSWQVDGKESWPTMTGRQQFRLEHDWYVAAGEALPVHKPAPAAGGNYPLRMTGGHTRWSVHTIWRGEPNLLRLQRGEPVLYMNADDASARGIADNDRGRISNDVGTFECLVKTAPSLQPGQVAIYHAWENFQFARHQGQQEPIPGPWKNLHLAGGYGQLHVRGAYAGPNFGPRGVTVEVQKV
ncbi:MAG: molybdopterin-dependent oxidoreductase [Deltaproteobacteria bacterium]|nr:molybdopterin-dependent oxidoreductase [Deltaproteobacteria bacterium]